MTESTYAIETRNLSKRFGNFTAVKDLTLKVPHGKIYGFVGPNGAGKTTTMKMMIGLMEPSSGEVLIDGTKVCCGQGQKLQIGYLPDVPGFYDWMTVEEYLSFCGELLGLEPAKISAQREELLSLVGLAHAKKKKTKGLSRGMRQRLGIAQALIGNPSIIFLDEPASALDPIGRKEIMDLILSLKGRATVFFSTHIISDIQRVCDHVLVLHNGELKLDQSLESLLGSEENRLIQLKVNGTKAQQEALEKEWEAAPWLERVWQKEKGAYTLLVREKETAGKALPVLLAAHQMELLRYESVNDLEAIFMEVVSQ